MSDTVPLEWSSDEPDSEQARYFSAGPAPILASGGFNSGKTVVAILKLLHLADTYPGYRAVVARRFASELKQTTLQTFYSLCPPEAIKRKNEGQGAAVIDFQNGSRFIFMHLNRPDASSILRGLEINGALLDQAEEIHEEVYDILEARLGRWAFAHVPTEVRERFEQESGQAWPYQTKKGLALPPSHMLLTCNPDLETHWLWRRFHPDSAEYQEVWKKEGYRMITFDSRKNKFASQENIRILLRKDDAFQARYVRGEWGNPEGVFFKVPTMSILEPTEELFKSIREGAKLWRILDHGDTGVTCCLWVAVDKEGNLIVYREYYVEDLTVREHRKNIKAASLQDKRENGNEATYRNLADPSIFNRVPARIGGRTLPSRWTVANEYADSRNYPQEDKIDFDAADHEEFPSRERIRDLLVVDPEHLHPVTRETGAPRLYFVKKTADYQGGCFHAITETRSARRIKIGSVNGRPVFSDERDEEVPDHALDCVRYIANARPAAFKVPKPKAGVGTWQGYAALTKKWRRERLALEATSK